MGFGEKKNIKVHYSICSGGVHIYRQSYVTERERGVIHIIVYIYSVYKGPKCIRV